MQVEASEPHYFQARGGRLTGRFPTDQHPLRCADARVPSRDLRFRCHGQRILAAKRKVYSLPALVPIFSTKIGINE